MKIQSTYNYLNNYNIKSSTPKLKLENDVYCCSFGKLKLNSDIFIRKKDNKNSDFIKFINKKGKVTQKEFEKIKKNQPHVLTECYKMCEQEEEIIAQPETFARASVALKEYYDSLYDNYTILSVGTSPAPFTEIMQNLGCNVIFLPITNLNRLEINPLHFLRHQYPTLASKHPNIELLMRYCTKKGIRKNKGDFIILDFSYTGKTLDLMQKILTERGDLNPEKLHKHSLMKDLGKITETQNNDNIIDSEDTSLIYTGLYLSHYEKLSNVPHFLYNGNDEYYDKATTVTSYKKRPHQIFKEFDEYSTPLGRAWSLCALDEANKIINIS